jgi:hypothetical protein
MYIDIICLHILYAYNFHELNGNAKVHTQTHTHTHTQACSVSRITRLLQKKNCGEQLCINASVRIFHTEVCVCVCVCARARVCVCLYAYTLRRQAVKIVKINVADSEALCAYIGVCVCYV